MNGIEELKEHRVNRPEIQEVDLSWLESLARDVPEDASLIHPSWHGEIEIPESVYDVNPALSYKAKRFIPQKSNAASLKLLLETILAENHFDTDKAYKEFFEQCGHVDPNSVVSALTDHGYPTDIIPLIKPLLELCDRTVKENFLGHAWHHDTLGLDEYLSLLPVPEMIEIAKKDILDGTDNYIEHLSYSDQDKLVRLMQKDTPNLRAYLERLADNYPHLVTLLRDYPDNHGDNVSRFLAIKKVAFGPHSNRISQAHNLLRKGPVPYRLLQEEGCDLESLGMNHIRQGNRVTEEDLEILEDSIPHYIGDVSQGACNEHEHWLIVKVDDMEIFRCRYSIEDGELNLGYCQTSNYEDDFGMPEGDIPKEIIASMCRCSGLRATENTIQTLGGLL